MVEFSDSIVRLIDSADWGADRGRRPGAGDGIVGERICLARQALDDGK
jgi:hypothetical protein